MYRQKELIERVREEIDWEEKYLKEIKKSFSQLPEGHLAGSRTREYRYDYHVVLANGKKKKKIIKTETEEGRRLKQQLLKKRRFLHDRAAIRRNRKHLDNLSARFCECGSGSVVFPWMTVELETWKEEEYKKYDGYSDFRKVPTKNGELVRSKSEAGIYDELLDRNEIFRYESELVLPSGRRIFPDFIIIRKSDNKPIIWEHMGALDKPGKPERYMERIVLLGESGFRPADNLIITWESREKPFTAASARRVIGKYLDGNGFC